jgi:outer membrane protein assembly factor BamE (lipoprotein component of BamABCDE complex)
MKSKVLASSFGLALALAFSGCMSSGNESLRKESEQSVAQKIVEGKTTKAEIKKMFGSPSKTTFTDGGLETVTYELAKMKADGVNYIPLVGLLGTSASGTKKELVILFDNDGVVKKYSMSESPVQVKTGIFNSGE